MSQVIRPSGAKHWKTTGLSINIDAGEIAEELAKEIRDHTIASIEANRSPSGRGQPALKGSAAKRAARGDRPNARGVTRFAVFIKSIITRVTKTGKRAASIFVGTDNGFFTSWLIRENRRGAEYFSVSGQVEKIIDRVLRRNLDRSVK